MSGSQQLLVAGGSAGLITVDAADFDGTADYLTRGAGLTGAADGKTGIFSAWIRIDAGNGTLRGIFRSATTLGGASNLFRVSILAANTIQVLGLTSASGAALGVGTTNTYTAGATWYHILSSWNVANNIGYLYINDSSDEVGSTQTNAEIDYTQADWGVGCQPDGSALWNGCLAEIYFAPNQFLDISSATNRRRFISSTGKPVSLGPNGALATGVAPLVYLHLDDGEAASDLGTNLGSGGNLAITGTLDTCSSSPSD